ncbi:hypothetical protein M752DRAFT_313235 [Aspergillus phoenicis ATCC 13157]|uniref:Acyl-CoA dehydrogenase/oxidase N-terminal domain-containing protein n=1 Tax=Aspergillus phoenicis ATCC 13157 TaxID=1353007 RepID=A0A370PQF5_ASPPH|nr:hypothetical protein CBS147346_3731 [Aspergillus niger]RDK44410.1 hypothetical protein M752DRAFT_313235 [Aspergillus phoenicis ATCC 13157]
MISRETLSPAYADYSVHTDQFSRFRATQSYYAKLVQAGLLKVTIPKSAAGACEEWVNHGLIVEELHNVDTSLSIHLIGTVLGLLPHIIGGTAEQKKFLAPFLSCDRDHLASLMRSGSGDTASHLKEGGKGLEITARKEEDIYIVNGEKLWTTSSATLDGKGVTLSCLVACCLEDGGTENRESPGDNIMVLLMTRDIIAQNSPGAYAMLSEPDFKGQVRRAADCTAVMILISDSRCIRALASSANASPAVCGLSGFDRTALRSKKRAATENIEKKGRGVQ